MTEKIESIANSFHVLFIDCHPFLANAWRWQLKAIQWWKTDLDHSSRANYSALVTISGWRHDNRTASVALTLARSRWMTVSFSRGFYVLSKSYFHRLNMAETDVPWRWRRVMLSLLVVAFSRRDFGVVSVTLKKSDMLEELLSRVFSRSILYFIC